MTPHSSNCTHSAPQSLSGFASTATPPGGSNTPETYHIERTHKAAGTRVRGTTGHSRRPVMTPEKRARLAKRAQEAQRAAGIVVRTTDPEHRAAHEEQAGGAMRSIVQWLSSASKAVYQSLPVMPALGLPTADGAALPAKSLGEGGVVTITYNFAPQEHDPELFIDTYREILPPGFQPEHVPREVPTIAEPLNPGEADSQGIRDALRKLYPHHKIHTVEALPYCNYPYPRNLAIEGPHGMLTNTREASFRLECARVALTRYFDQKGIPYAKAPADLKINFANVQWVPDLDMLVVADVDKPTRDWLLKAYDNPTRQLTLFLNNERETPSGKKLCYDMDIAFYVVPTQNDDWVALIHDPCIEEWHLQVDSTISTSVQTSTPLSDILAKTGLKVIRLSEADTLRLTANALTSYDGSGRLLMTDPTMSKKLKKDLQQAGVTPVTAGERLGHSGNTISHFGIHCLTLHIPAYRAEPTESGSQDLSAEHDKSDL